MSWMGMCPSKPALGYANACNSCKGDVLKSFIVVIALNSAVETSGLHWLSSVNALICD